MQEESFHVAAEFATVLNLTEWDAARRAISGMREDIHDPSAGLGKHFGCFARGEAVIPPELLAALFERHQVTLPTSRDTDGEPDGLPRAPY